MTGLDRIAFRARIVVPTLQHLGLWSAAAEWLVMATAVTESNLSALVQTIGGPALGVYQIEPDTHDDVLSRVGDRHQELFVKMTHLAATYPSRYDQLVTNLAYATAICRLKYYLDPEPLPAQGDRHALAWYYKRVWNTSAGAASEAQFLLNNRDIA